MLVADSLIVIGLATVSLGTIQETDGPKEHTFWLRNVGTEPVTLQQGYTSCGCTTIHFEQARQIQPGDSTAVTLRFNPRGKGGEFEEVGTIVYQKTPDEGLQTSDKGLQTTDEGLQTTDNNFKVYSLESEVYSQNSEVYSHKRVSMSLIGTCITSEETLLRQFPISINDSIRISTNRFDLGIMHVGESKERGVVVLYKEVGDASRRHQERIPVLFTVDAATPKGLQHVPYPITIGDQQVTIILDVLIK